MPRPALLPTIPWPAVLAAGVDWTSWLARAEDPAVAAAMAADAAAFRPPAAVAAQVAGLRRPVRILCIAEDWCGDVVRHVPVLAALAALNPLIELRFIARAENLELFARFLTNGGEAIPVMIFLSEAHVQCGHWGPMPAACRRWIALGKAVGDGGTARQRVSALYQADPLRRTVAEELAELIALAGAESL